MERYVYLLLLVLVVVAQVALGGFLITPLGIIPIFILYIWLIKKRVSSGSLIFYAFLGGLLVDLLGSSVIGKNAVASVFAVIAIQQIGSQEKSEHWGYRVLSLLVSLALYLGLTYILTVCCNQIR